MCSPCLARTNDYGDPAELSKAINRLRAQGFKERRKREALMPGEYIVGEKLDPWGNVIATVQWRAHGAPLPFRAAPEAIRQAPPRQVSTPKQREAAILAELAAGSRTRADLLFALRKIGSEGTIEDALQALLGRGEVVASREKYGRHRFARVVPAAARAVAA